MDPQRFTPYQRKSAKKSAAKAPVASHGPDVWTPEEDDVLRRAVYKHGGKKWKAIATFFTRKSPSQCNQRWNELQNHGTAVKKPWCPDEDLRMLELVKIHGAGKWAVIASYLPGRNGKQCRERWHNQLNPAIRKGPWTPEEDLIILEMQQKYGNRWAKITEKLPGRTDNAVKNHWHSSMKARVKRSSSNGGDKKRPASKQAVSAAPGPSGAEASLSSDGDVVVAVASPPAQVFVNFKVEPGSQSPESVAMCPSQIACLSRIPIACFPRIPSLDDDDDMCEAHDEDSFALPQELIDEVTQLMPERLTDIEADSAMEVEDAEDETMYVSSLLDELSQDELVLSTDDTDSDSPAVWFENVTDDEDEGDDEEGSGDDLDDCEEISCGLSPSDCGVWSCDDDDEYRGEDDGGGVDVEDTYDYEEVVAEQLEAPHLQDLVRDDSGSIDADFLKVLRDLPLESPSFESLTLPDEPEDDQQHEMQYEYAIKPEPTPFVDPHAMIMDDVPTAMAPLTLGSQLLSWTAAPLSLPDAVMMTSLTSTGTDTLEPLLYDDGTDAFSQEAVSPLTFEEACEFVHGSLTAAAAAAAVAGTEAKMDDVLRGCDLM